MRAKDTRTFISDLLDWAKAPDPEALWPPLVKICGIRTMEEAIFTANAGAAMLGLMFVPTSKRCISLEQAQAISSTIRGLRASTAPPALSESPDDIHNDPWFTLHARRLSQSVAASAGARPLLVGVFQDQPLSFVLHCVAVAQLDMVQLHGSEPLEWAKQIPVPVIRVYHVDPDGRGLEGIARPGLHRHVLLDAAVSPGALSGGSGKTFDWELAKRVVLAGEGEPTTGDASSTSSSPLPIVLAGGLTPDNVAEAVSIVRPWAVDVSGGVETDDGTGKDIDKVKGFINAVRECELPA